MKLKLNKKYIDELGNISITKPFINHNGKEHKSKLLLEHIDNINNKDKKPVTGKKEHIFGFNGLLEGIVKGSPYAPIKRFTFIDEKLLKIKRFLKNKICERIKKRKEKIT